MRIITCAALSALLFAAPASAESVELRCKIIGPAAHCWGALQVMLDEAARHVRFTADKQQGVAWDYQDGATASIYSGRIQPERTTPRPSRNSSKSPPPASS
jgi:hypothetical protein